MKIKIFFLLIFIFLIGEVGLSQITFQKSYSSFGGYGVSVQQTLDEGYIIVGWISENMGEVNICLIKTDKYGDTLWVKKFADGIGYSVQQTSDGGYIIGGKTMYSSTDGLYIIKTDFTGNIIWSKIYNTHFFNEGFSLQETTDGGYVIAGSVVTNSSNDYKVYVIKINNIGDTLWTKSYGDTTVSPDYGYSIKQTNDNGYIITGTFDDSVNIGTDVYLIKTDNNGNLLWSKTYGGTSNEWGYDVQQTRDGGFIIAGVSISFSLGWSGYLIRTDEYGNVIWTKIYSEIDNSMFFKCIRETNDGGFIVAGYDGYDPLNRDAFLVKIDDFGNVRWTKFSGDSGSKEGACIQQTNDGGYIITGGENSIGYESLYLIKTDDNGNSGCNQHIKNINVISPSTQIMDPATQVFSFTNTTIVSPNPAVSRGCSIKIFCFSKGISDNGFEIFPNPSNNYFTIYSPYFTINKIEIFNTLGEIVYLNEMVNQESKEIFSALTSGIYFVNVTTNKNKLIEKLIIVKH